MSWKTCTLDECISLRSGSTPSKQNPSFWNGTIPWVSSKELKLLRLYDTESRVTREAIKSESSLIDKGTVLIVVRGMVLAKEFPVSIAQATMTFNQDLKAVDPKGTAIDRSFLPYLLLGHREGLRSLADEAAHGTKRIQTDRLLAYKVKLPSAEVQKRIASILSAYDDLIENNTRRIEILEETARRVYEEWFVQFRFPGHVDVDFKESELGLIPAGWEIVTVGDAVGRISTGPKYCQRTVSVSGSIPVLDQGKHGMIGYHNDEPGVWASPIDPIIVFANHTCYQKIIFHPFSTIQNVLPFKSSRNYKRNIYWLQHATHGIVELNDYKGHWPQFISKKIIVAEEHLTDRFGRLIEPVYHLIFSLQKRNINLRTQRDLLLPKLISGEIDVSDIPMPT